MRVTEPAWPCCLALPVLDNDKIVGHHYQNLNPEPTSLVCTRVTKWKARTTLGWLKESMSVTSRSTGTVVSVLCSMTFTATSRPAHLHVPTSENMLDAVALLGPHPPARLLHAVAVKLGWSRSACYRAAALVCNTQILLNASHTPWLCQLTKPGMVCIAHTPSNGATHFAWYTRPNDPDPISSPNSMRSSSTCPK